jgi:hypothetical protein
LRYSDPFFILRRGIPLGRATKSQGLASAKENTPIKLKLRISRSGSEAAPVNLTVANYRKARVTAPLAAEAAAALSIK